MMKARGAILLGLLFTFSTFADTTFYGAWYTTTKFDHSEAKDSGGATIVLKGDLNAESGAAVIIATVNARGTFINFQGRWQRTGAHSYHVEFGAEKPGLNGQLSWRGTYNPTTGQCSGNWAGDGSRGRFQTRQQ